MAIYDNSEDFSRIDLIHHQNVNQSMPSISSVQGSFSEIKNCGRLNATLGSSASSSSYLSGSTTIKQLNFSNTSSSFSTSTSIAEHLNSVSCGVSEPLWVFPPSEQLNASLLQWDNATTGQPRGDTMATYFRKDNGDTSSFASFFKPPSTSVCELPDVLPWKSSAALSDNLGPTDSLTTSGSMSPQNSSTNNEWSVNVLASLLDETATTQEERGLLNRLQNLLSLGDNIGTPVSNESLKSLGILERWNDSKNHHNRCSTIELDNSASSLIQQQRHNSHHHRQQHSHKSLPITRLPSNESEMLMSTDWRSNMRQPSVPSTLQQNETLPHFHSSLLHSLSTPFEDPMMLSLAPYRSPQPVPPGLQKHHRFLDKHHRHRNTDKEERRKERFISKPSKMYHTKPGEQTSLSPSCAAILPSLPPEALAPLHIVLPINFSYGKIVIASPTSSNNPREHPLHHYYFQRQFPSANNLFSRLHGLCNQSPSWLALDIGYVACREHQVAAVVDLFNNFFRQRFQTIAKRRRQKSNRQQCETSRFNNPTTIDSSSLNESLLSASSVEPPMFMDPIRLRCSGLRLREDHGSGWYLYETPVEACSEKDSIDFKEVIRLIESFNEHVRDSRLCQNATMKPFMNNQFAIVVLKQEGSGISERELARMNDFKCEGVEISEIRLVRHKLQDRYGNAMFERDPRFGEADIFGRPIAHSKNGKHGRFVFAKAALPQIVRRLAHQIHPTMTDLEQDSDFSDGDDDIHKQFSDN